MNARLGWERIEDGGHLIGLFDETGGAAISLEPGGQFELSGAPFETAHETADELARHWRSASVAKPFGLSALSLGMSPKWTLAETPTMPKSRYDIMRRYMPQGRDTRARHDVPHRDGADQSRFPRRKDMVLKLRVALALQPAITALFANSPFTEGKLNGFLSARSEIWRDTDADRTGMLPFAFEPGMGFERYVDYALDVPMYFLKRGSTYIDVAGASFRDLLDGRLAAAPGERATIADWANHLSTIFPEVRLKRYLEMRGADVGPPERIVAMTALTSGLFYDPARSPPPRRWSRTGRPRIGRPCATRFRGLGFAATIRGRSLRDVAVDMVAIARGGLARRANRNAKGEDETVWLAPLETIAGSGRSPARKSGSTGSRPVGPSVGPAFDGGGVRLGASRRDRRDARQRALVVADLEKAAPRLPARRGRGILSAGAPDQRRGGEKAPAPFASHPGTPPPP